MDIVEGVRKLGFRKWYERQLIEAHAWLVTGFLAWLLGWRLPVGGIADWIEGRPAPGRAARVERDAGRIVFIEQDGWTIRLPESLDTVARPRRLLLERAAGPNAPAVSLRLIVDEPTG